MTLDELDYEYKQRKKAIVEELEDIKTEIEGLLSSYGYLDMHTNNDVLEIIDNHIVKLKGESNE